MARYLGPACKLSRREGVDLLLKSGVKAHEQKCKAKTPPGSKRSGGPGGASSRSDYGIHLREKQKLRRIYGVLERQFRNYFKKADRARAATGEALVQFLESRLDNLVYRMGFAVTRAQARQLVSHGKVLVDGRRVTVPSYLARPGQRVEMSDAAKKMLTVKDAALRKEETGADDWMDVNFEEMSGIYRRLPAAAAAAPDVNLNLIVEYYSK